MQQLIQVGDSIGQWFHCKIKQSNCNFTSTLPQVFIFMGKGAKLLSKNKTIVHGSKLQVIGCALSELDSSLTYQDQLGNANSIWLRNELHMNVINSPSSVQ
ncbi:hypothetical protein U1Q18_052689 [Sarracenia purpurea var. burkii]